MVAQKSLVPLSLMSDINQRNQLHDGQAERSNFGDKSDSIFSKNSRPNQQRAIAGASGTDTIEQSTCVSECLSFDGVAMLVGGTDALAHAGNPNDAIENPMKPVEYWSTSSERHITAENIYAMQGKQQTAIDIQESELHSVSPSKQGQLYDQLTIAKKLLDQRIDFMSRLPIEITHNIFTWLVKDTVLVSCAAVSKLWRHILLQQCPELWRTVIIEDQTFSDPAVILLPLITDHVQSLEVHKDDKKLLKKLTSIGANHRFPSLTDLTIVTSCPKLLISLLRDTLTRVAISIRADYREEYNSDEYPVDFPVDSILTACSNLKELSITSDVSVTYQQPEMLSFGSCRLTRLFIKSSSSLHILKDLIPLCPGLEMLCVLGKFSPTVLLTLIEKHCPLLGHLRTIEQPSTDKFIDTKYTSNNDQTGMHMLQYGIMRMEDIQTIVPTVAKHARTLTTLELQVVNYDDFQDGLKQLTAIKLRQVRNLGLSACGHAVHFGAFVASLIQHCPLLEAVTLNFQNATIPKEFFMGLAKHQRLHTLEVLYAKSYTSSGLQRMLTSMSALGPECMLKNITVEFSKIVDDEVLAALGRIQTLQSIQIACPFIYDNVTANGVDAFIAKLLTMPQLTKLRLGSMPYITDSMLCLLAEKSGLHTLILTNIDSITSDGVRAMANRLCSSLRTIRVSGPQVDSNAQGYLKK